MKTFISSLRIKGMLIALIFSGIINYSNKVYSGTPGLWKGMTTAWNLSNNWDDNVIPTSSTDVVIPPNPTGGQFPKVNTTAHCRNLTIAAKARLTVNSGKTLYVAGDLLIQSNSTGAGAILPIGTLSISGTVCVQRYIPGISGYHYISTPVSNATLSQINTVCPLVNLGFGYYDPAHPPKAKSMPNIWKMDETHSTPDPASREAWLAPSSLSETIEIMRGYTLIIDAGLTLNFTGSGTDLTDGDQTFFMTKTDAPFGAYGTGGNGWSLVGNPYPSPIDWDLVANDLPPQVSQSVAFFKATTKYTGGFAYYHPIAGSSGAYIHNKYIPSMQSFYMNTSSPAVITFKNSHRTVTADAMGEEYYKSGGAKVKNTRPLIRISGTYNDGSTGYRDETVLFFDPAAKNTFSSKTDAHKFMNSEPTIPNIYTLKNNEKLAINGLPEITDNLAVPLGYEITLAGTYTISANEISNFDTLTTQIYLEDLAMNVSQDLIKNPDYIFTIKPGDKGSRFFLRFKLKETGISKKETGMDLCEAYAADNTLIVNNNSKNNSKCSIIVYDLTGKAVFTVKSAGTGHHEYNPGQIPGCYLVKVITEENVTVKKIFIN
jgi:hypothetical protein